MTTRIAFGTMALTPVYNPAGDFSLAEAALHTALDEGVRVFHSAHHYGDGRALTHLNRVLAERRMKDAVRVIAKIDTDPARMLTGPEGIGETLELLGRDYLDVAQLVGWSPWATAETPTAAILDDLERGGPIRTSIERLRDDGTVRAVAVEVTRPDDARRAADVPGVSAVVCDYSIIRQVVPPHDVPAPIRDGRVQVVALRPLCGGWLTDRYRTLDDYAETDFRREWYAAGAAMRSRVADVLERHGLTLPEAALRFLHQRPYPQVIAVGMRTPDQVREALSPRNAVPLPPAVFDELSALFEQPTIVEPD